MILENVGVSITVPTALRNKGELEIFHQILPFKSFIQIKCRVILVFIAPDLTKTRQKLLSNFQIDIGDLPSEANKTISFYLISLVEGSIELTQKVWYHANKMTATVTTSNSTEFNLTTNNNDSPDKPIVPELSEKAIQQQQQRQQSHNINIEFVNDVIVKSKKETIVIPCTAEFLFTGKFFSLNKEALTKAYKNEDFLLRIDLEIKSMDIDILDMFLICVSMDFWLS